VASNKQIVIGIDLGTTNSCVAIVKDGKPTVIANRGGYKTTPSMVAMTETKRRVVGHLAKRQAITNSEHTVHAAKRLIGRTWTSEQVQHARKTAPYKVVEGKHGDLRISLRGELYSLPEISAMVLAEMKVIAEEFVGGEVTKAVITVPAYFNDNQRQATKDAGSIAGLEVIRIINEPTAAALAYGFGRNVDKKIAVYDLGGGTFDISILDISSEGVFNVLATAGDSFLGGEDFDQRTTDWLIDNFEAVHNLDIRKDRTALQRIRDAAEKAKIELSSIQEAELNLPFIANLGDDPVHLRNVLNRTVFDSLTKDLVDRTVELMDEALKKAELERDDIDEVVLAGGMTRVPRVERVVAEFFGREPCKGVHPDEVVALGAAVQGAALVDDTGEFGELLLLDVTPHTLGVMVHGGGVDGVIPQNTTVPVSRTQMFTTSRDNQTTVRIIVVQGEDERADRNELLGEFELQGLRRAPAGQLEIDVAFALNADGIMAISATDRESGAQQSISVKPTSGLTPAEIAEMIAKGKAHLAARKRDEAFEAKRQEAEILLLEGDRIFTEHTFALGPQLTDEYRMIAKRAMDAIERQDAPGLTEHVAVLGSIISSVKGIRKK
jgi:molecular chaperone DnaK